MDSAVISKKSLGLPARLVSIDKNLIAPADVLNYKHQRLTSSTKRNTINQAATTPHIYRYYRPVPMVLKVLVNYIIF